MTTAKFFFYILVWLSLMMTVPAWADYEAGKEAYDKGDYETALKQWRPLAEQGDARAQFNLGWMYNQGLGVQQDFQEAARWFRLAANQGGAQARFQLGVLYAQGLGVSQNYGEAAKWVRLSAEQGETEAQFNLGRMYFEGLGVAQDWVLALMWTHLAAAQGHETAIQVQEVLKERLRDDQIAEAQRLAREWKPKKK